jgi:hypothetical protein
MQFLLDKFLEYIKKADHILKVTYPKTKEEKLFLEGINNLYYGTKSLVMFVSKKPELPIAKQVKILENNPAFSELIRTFKQLNFLMKSYKNDLISFKRKDSFIICTNNYKVEVITLSLLTDLLEKVIELYQFAMRHP